MVAGRRTLRNNRTPLSRPGGFLKEEIRYFFGDKHPLHTIYNSQNNFFERSRALIEPHPEEVNRNIIQPNGALIEPLLLCSISSALFSVLSQHKFTIRHLKRMREKHKARGGGGRKSNIQNIEISLASGAKIHYKL